MARKNEKSCLTVIILWPFYLLWYCFKFAFLFTWEMIKFPYNLIRELSKNSYKEKRNGTSGYDYEIFIAEYLKSYGYSTKVTPKSGDYGVDIIAKKGSNKYAVQCKYYSSPVGIEAVQQVVGGMAHYNCNKAMVITNSTFTQSAKRLAAENRVALKPLIEMGHINRINAIKSVLTVIFGLLFIGALISMEQTGIRNIPKENIPAYVIIIVMFCGLLLSNIVSKIKNKITLRKINKDIIDIEKKINDLERRSIKSPKSRYTAANFKRPEQVIINSNESIENQITSFILQTGITSIAQIQRKFGLSFQKTYQVFESLESKGIISPKDKNGLRQVNMTYYEWLKN